MASGVARSSETNTRSPARSNSLKRNTSPMLRIWRSVCSVVLLGAPRAISAASSSPSAYCSSSAQLVAVRAASARNCQVAARSFTMAAPPARIAMPASNATDSAISCRKRSKRGNCHQRRVLVAVPDCISGKWVMPRFPCLAARQHWMRRQHGRWAGYIIYEGAPRAETCGGWTRSAAFRGTCARADTRAASPAAHAAGDGRRFAKDISRGNWRRGVRPGSNRRSQYPGC